MHIRDGRRLKTTLSNRFYVLLCSAAAMLFAAGCSQSERSAPEGSRVGEATEKAAEAQEPTEAEVATPVWVERSRSWPDTISFIFDSTLQVIKDGLMLRLKTDVSQDVSGLRFENERPLLTEVLMTVRPIPKWELAMGLKIDSVILHDPVKDRDLRAVPMLSFQRTYEGGTVRTQFLANMAERHRQSPDLEEGQLLEPTIHLTWDERHIVASVPPIRLAYMRNP